MDIYTIQPTSDGGGRLTMAFCFKSHIIGCPKFKLKPISMGVGV